MSLLGAILPVFFWLGWAGAWPGLIPAWGANGASAVPMWDLIISVTVFAIFAISECIARRDYFPLVALPVTVMIGLSSGLPLYLFLRTRTRT